MLHEIPEAKFNKYHISHNMLQQSFITAVLIFELHRSPQNHWLFCLSSQSNPVVLCDLSIAALSQLIAARCNCASKTPVQGSVVWLQAMEGQPLPKLAEGESLVLKEVELYQVTHSNFCTTTSMLSVLIHMHIWKLGGWGGKASLILSDILVEGTCR